jgi:energy-converting hydrogenase Eha subunit E
VISVPELRAAMLDQYAAAMMLLSDVVAERVGRAADDPLVRTLAGAVIGVSMAAVLAIADDPTADLWSLLDTALAQLEEGFSL